MREPPRGGGGNGHPKAGKSLNACPDLGEVSVGLLMEYTPSGVEGWVGMGWSSGCEPPRISYGSEPAMFTPALCQRDRACLWEVLTVGRAVVNRLSSLYGAEPRENTPIGGSVLLGRNESVEWLRTTSDLVRFRAGPVHAHLLRADRPQSLTKRTGLGYRLYSGPGAFPEKKR